MFRTATGQTGTDAYIYEAAAIANAQRELNARTTRLAEAMASELKPNTTVRISIASDRFPNAFMESRAGDGLERMILLQSLARDAEYLGQIARGIADSTYVVRHAE